MSIFINIDIYFLFPAFFCKEFVSVKDFSNGNLGVETHNV
jgi:hypothetical protein